MPNEPKRNEKRGTGKGATVKTSPAAIERHDRDLKCVELRKSGMHWQAIADELDYSSPGHAYDRFQVVMRDYPREDVETWRNTICDRYDVMLAALWPAVLEGKWLAVERATRILESQAKLMGANRPDKVEVSAGATALDTALRELEAEMKARAGDELVPQE
jgi:hypothetical protein